MSEVTKNGASATSGFSRALDGKNVLVTGAGTGLGRAYAIHAARSGALVGINDVDGDRVADVVDGLDRMGLPAVALAGDISDWDTAEEVVENFVSEAGAIDGLVSNAAVFYTSLPWMDSGPEIARLVTINVLGVLFGGIHAMRHMVGKGSGSIVNVTSGARLGLATMGAYGASKGAVVSATYSWAIDLAGTGVRVNALSPRAQTRMAVAGRGSDAPPLSQPEDVAPLATYLLSDLSGSLTGQVLRLDGSELSMLPPPPAPQHVLRRDAWTVEDIASAIAGFHADKWQ